MKNKALIVIDLQNDITKNYKKIIGQVNEAYDGKCNNRNKNPCICGCSGKTFHKDRKGD